MRHERDYYQTPMELARAWGRLYTPIWIRAHGASIANETRFVTLDAWHLVDMGAGDGRLTSAIKGMHCAGFDVEPRAEWVERASLADFQPPGTDYLAIISNPPFSQAKEFLLEADSYSGVKLMSFLLPLSFLASAKRAEMWDVVGYPDRLDILVPRPSFTGNGTAHEDYALMWWGVVPEDKGVYRLEWR